MQRRDILGVHVARDPDLAFDLGSDLLSDLHRLTEQKGRATDVEERFIEGDWLYQRRVRQQYLAEAVGVHAIGLEIRGQEHRIGGQA